MFSFKKSIRLIVALSTWTLALGDFYKDVIVPVKQDERGLAKDCSAVRGDGSPECAAAQVAQSLFPTPRPSVFGGFCKLPEDAEGPRADFIRFMQKEYFPALDILLNFRCNVVDEVTGAEGLCVSPCEVMENLVDTISDPCARIEEFKSTVKYLDRFGRALKKANKIPIIKKVSRKLEPIVNGIVAKLRSIASIDKQTCKRGTEKAKSKLETFRKKLAEAVNHFGLLNTVLSVPVDLLCLQESIENEIEDNGVRGRSLRTFQSLKNIEASYEIEGRRHLQVFDELCIDFERLNDMADKLRPVLNVINDFRRFIECLRENLQLELLDVFSFFDVMFNPLEAFLNFLEPIISAITRIIDSVSFLQCPRFLGFVCDLDSIVEKLIEKILSIIGIDIDKILSDLIGGLFDAILPDIPFPSFPSFDFLDFDFDLEIFDQLKDLIASILDDLTFDLLVCPDSNANAVAIPDDTTVNGVFIDFRYSKGTLSSLEITCPSDMVPVGFAATATTACGTTDLSPALEVPCIGSSSCNIDVRPFLPDDGECKDNLSLPALGYGYITGMFDSSTIMYACVQQSDVRKIHAMPPVISRDMTQFNDLVCAPGSTVLPLGYTYENKPRIFTSAGSPHCDSRLKLDAIQNTFGSTCGPGDSECPTGFIDGNQCGVVDGIKKQVTCGGFLNLSCKCNKKSTQEIFQLKEGKYTCLTPGRDVFDSANSNLKTAFATRTSRSTIKSIRNCGSVQCSKTACFGLAAGASQSVVDNHISSNIDETLRMECPADRVVHVVEVLKETYELDGTLKSTTDSTASARSTCERESVRNKCNVDDPRILRRNLLSSGLSSGLSPGLINNIPPQEFSLKRATYECICGEGFHPIPENGVCVPCSAGMFRADGMDKCTTCKPGQFSSAGAATCSDCPAGQFNDDVAAQGCTKCLAGFFQPESGSTECVACPAGSFSNPGAPVCTLCPVGHTSNGATSKCFPVDAGYFNNGDGVQPCSPGTYSDTLGAAECKACPPGTYSRSPGSTECVTCPLGTYSSVSGQAECTRCPFGSMTTTPGAQTQDECVTSDFFSSIDYQSAEYANLSCAELLALDLTGNSALSEAEKAFILEYRVKQVGNGMCNLGGPWNTPQCGYDGGDCCSSSCQKKEFIEAEDNENDLSFHADLSCTWSTYNCIDPLYAESEVDFEEGTGGLVAFGKYWDDDEEVCPEAGEEDPFGGDVALMMGNVGDGVCDPQLNTAEFNFDGGDCCVATCLFDPSFPESCITDCHCHLHTKPSLVFVTAQGYAGNAFGGLSGADAICTEEARAAGYTSNFVAWLSDSTIDARDRIVHSSNPYVLADGTVVANNFDDLVDGALEHFIDQTITGTSVSARVWTGTGTDGTASENCQNWTSDEGNGRFGISTTSQDIPRYWTSRGPHGCFKDSRLYCFEQ